MKTILLASIFSAVFGGEAFAGDFERVLALKNGAAIVAKGVTMNSGYSELKVEYKGKRYSICRYGADLQKLLCKNPAKPYIWVNAKKMGWMESEAANIENDLSVSLSNCENSSQGLVFGGITCSSEQY